MFCLFLKSSFFRRSAWCVRRFSRLMRQNLPLLQYRKHFCVATWRQGGEIHPPAERLRFNEARLHSDNSKLDRWYTEENWAARVAFLSTRVPWVLEFIYFAAFQSTMSSSIAGYAGWPIFCSRGIASLPLVFVLTTSDLTTTSGCFHFRACSRNNA